jgi:type II secretory pathway pseudopilin PulG
MYRVVGQEGSRSLDELGEAVRSGALAATTPVEGPDGRVRTAESWLAGGSDLDVPERRPVGPWLIGLAGLGVLVLGGLVALMLPVFQQFRHVAMRDQTASRLTALNLGLMVYATDYDDRYPPVMDDSEAVRPLLAKYVPSDEDFRSLNPAAGDFRGNATLASAAVAKVPEPERTLVFFDRLPWPEGVRLALTVDGRIHRIKAADFERALSAASR